MYINDTHIGFYLIASLIGLLVGQFVDWIKERLPENKKVFSIDIIRRYKIDFRPNYLLMLVTSAIYVILVYNFGIQDNFIGNLNLIQYLILTPMLLSAFAIDYKLQIIPNRLNLTIFETGLIIAFLYGMSNVAITIDMLLGMIAGIAIFLIITLIGGLVYGKESMGLGDIKFIGALGLYFGLTKITVISIIAFLIGAIIGVILIITKRKKADEYIPFGPFIVIAAFICILVPFETVITALKVIFTLKI
ncbi:MAG: prepilin peptidase [Clostridia bacterium]|nr:prepilin peptidase [Clostridia bacterium]